MRGHCASAASGLLSVSTAGTGFAWPVCATTLSSSTAAAISRTPPLRTRPARVAGATYSGSSISSASAPAGCGSAGGIGTPHASLPMATLMPCRRAATKSYATSSSLDTPGRRIGAASRKPSGSARSAAATAAPRVMTFRFASTTTTESRTSSGVTPAGTSSVVKIAPSRTTRFASESLPWNAMWPRRSRRRSTRQIQRQTPQSAS